MEKITAKEMTDDLIKAIVSIDSIEMCEAFFKDLLTEKEVEQFAQRLRAAKLLLEGKTYVQIIELTGISSATLSRASNFVKTGSGVCVEVLKRIAENKD